MTLLTFDRPETKGLVSIVMPTRQGARYIGSTLETIGQQSYDGWELLVIEDGSRDGTEAIVTQFARRHRKHRVEYRCNPRNLGAAHTRNLAFAKAAGEYVALLDSDDRWLPDHLQVAVAALKPVDRDIVYSTVLMVEDGSDHVLGTWGPTAGELTDYPHSMFNRSFVTPSATVMRRQVLADVGEWNTDCRYCEDYDFWLRCIAAGKKFHYVGGCHCLYRKNHDGATTQKMSALLEEIAEVTERFIGLPSLPPRHGRKYAAQAFALAAEFHAKSSPAADPSADPARSSYLMWRAWRRRPEKLKYLWKAARFAATDLVRGRRAVTWTASASPQVIEQRAHAA